MNNCANIKGQRTTLSLKFQHNGDEYLNRAASTNKIINNSQKQTALKSERKKNSTQEQEQEHKISLIIRYQINTPPP